MFAVTGLHEMTRIATLVPDASSLPFHMPLHASERPDADNLDVRFSVSFGYQVLFTRAVFDVDNDTLRAIVAADGRQPARVAVFVDSGVAAAWPTLISKIQRYAAAHSDVIHLVREPEVVPGGEQAKQDMAVLDTVVHAISAGQICRHSYILAIGGGAMLDAVGFATATSHRGVRLVRLPTTTLAQADSGVGVKNGINRGGKKNFLGCFAPPWAVINDEHFLTTLSDRDWRAGIAEAVKVALLKDAQFFADIEASAQSVAERDAFATAGVLRRAAGLHVTHIVGGGDPFEMKSARPLDFGHWSAHKLEQMSGFRLRHGEAVAIGVALDTLISMMQGQLSRTAARRILACLGHLGLPIYDPLLEDARVLRDGIEEFREHLGGALAITLLQDIGRPIEVSTLDFEVVEKAVARLATVPANPNTSPFLFP